jgi:hypothetical protein
MNHIGTKVVLFATVALLLISIGMVAVAQDNVKPNVTISQLKGPWTATLSGVTGCGVTTLTTTFFLDATGNGTQTAALQHTAGCGDIDLTGQFVQIQSLKANGNGFIALGCGDGCGFGFNIQVSHDLQVFNMGAQPVGGNFLAGVAVHR